MSASSSAASRLRTPNRRQTFAPVTSTQRNRRMTMDASSASAIPRGGGGGGGGAAGTSNVAAGGSLSATTNKPKRAFMNSRASMIPRVGRENMIPPTPKALPPTTGGSSSHMATVVNNNRRRTMGGGGGGGGQYTHVGSEKRRQSILPPTTPTLATAKDPRPLVDKSYQQQCSKKLLDFLNDNGYSDQGYQISLKTLKMPSRKDFISIVTFMLRLVDPTFQDGSMKLEEEISMYFRSLGYPFPISKTSLAAAGATHTWPALLGALVWLMETLQHNAASAADNAGKGKAADGEDETETLESLEELEKKTDQTFFDYLAHAYMAFLREDDTRSELLEQQLADEFEADNNLLVQEIDRVGEMNQTIVEQIADLEKQFVEYDVVVFFKTFHCLPFYHDESILLTALFLALQ
jgi:kinetochore protein NDC80